MRPRCRHFLGRRSPVLILCVPTATNSSRLAIRVVPEEAASCAPGLLDRAPPLGLAGQALSTTRGPAKPGAALARRRGWRFPWRRLRLRCPRGDQKGPPW